MPKPDRQTALAICLKCHPGVVGDVGFSNRTVTEIGGKLESCGWGDPLAGADFGNVVVGVNAFIMAFEIVVPKPGAGGQPKESCFVRNVLAGQFRNDETKCHRVVERAHIKDETRIGV